MPAKPACSNRSRRSRRRLLPPAIGCGPWAWADVADFLTELPRLGHADVVFNLFEGFAGLGQGEALVAGWIEALGLPLTGSDAAALELVRDKAQVKWLLRGAGLPTADFVLVAPDRPRPVAALAELLAVGPAIVKPAHEDASLGIGPQSVVSDRAALEEQIALVQSGYGPVLVERFIAGREFNAAVLATPEPRLLPLAEIEFAAELAERERLVTYAAKWNCGSVADLATAPRCPARVEPALAERIARVALLGLRGDRLPRLRPGRPARGRRRRHLHPGNQRQSRHRPRGRFRPGVAGGGNRVRRIRRAAGANRGSSLEANKKIHRRGRGGTQRGNKRMILETYTIAI